MSTPSSPLTPDQRAQRTGTILKWVAFAVVGFVVSPFIMGAIQGMLGLLVAGAVCFVTWTFLPNFERKMANWRLKALKAEAAANPVETLQNNYQHAAEALEKKKQGLIDFKSGVRAYADQVGEFKRRWPQDGPKYDAILARLQATAVTFEAKYRESVKNLADFQMEIEKAEAEWNLGNAAAKAQGIAMTQGDFDDMISTKTALGSVQLNLDRALSDLDTIDLTISLPDGTKPALPEASGSVIDVDVEPAEKVKGRRIAH